MLFNIKIVAMWHHSHYCLQQQQQQQHPTKVKTHNLALLFFFFQSIGDFIGNWHGTTQLLRLSIIVTSYAAL